MVYIVKGKEKSLLRRHPWVFSGAIDLSRGGRVQAGVHKVLSSEGNFLAWGWYDADSHIPLRLLSWKEDDKPDGEWWERKTAESVERRRGLFASRDTNSFRLIHGEADFLPGVSCDKHGDVLRVVLSARPAFFNRKHIVWALFDAVRPGLLILNTDPAFCGIEHLKESTEYYMAGPDGEPEIFQPEKALDPIEIVENGVYYTFIPGTGQKSGFFCDQRNSRMVFEKYVREMASGAEPLSSNASGSASGSGSSSNASGAAGASGSSSNASGAASGSVSAFSEASAPCASRSAVSASYEQEGPSDLSFASASNEKRPPVVLDACCYTGSFTIHAMRGGAGSVDCVDSSLDALERMRRNVRLNAERGVIPADSACRVRIEKADMFEYLRSMEPDKYDIIVLDPPKLAKTQKDLQAAMKGYKDLNRIAMEKIKRGGILFTCSCSGALGWDDFRTVLGWAAKDAGVEVQILERVSQPEDHPVRLSFPESEYLKVFVLRVLSG